MTPDTPLTEVAHLLPTEQAARLALLQSEVQHAVLIDLRMIVVRWEQSGVSLDPITFSKVVAPVVDALTIDAVVLFMNAEGGK